MQADNKVLPLPIPQQAVSSDYLGGILGEATGKTLLDRSELRSRYNYKLYVAIYPRRRADGYFGHFQ